MDSDPAILEQINSQLLIVLNSFYEIEFDVPQESREAVYTGLKAGRKIAELIEKLQPRR